MSETLTQLAATIEAAVAGLPASEARLARGAVAILRGDVKACMSVCESIRIEHFRASLPPVLQQFAPEPHDPAR